MLVTNATVGVVTMPNGGPFALYAYGVAVDRRPPGPRRPGSLKVEINHLGQAVNLSLTLPTLPGETGPPPSIPIVFATPAFVERFAVGVDQNGNPTTDGLTIDLGGIFTIHGNVTFTKAADGSVDVNIPSASVAIKAPFDGHVQEVFSLHGAAAFSFGGPNGFQLQELPRQRDRHPRRDRARPGERAAAARDPGHRVARLAVPPASGSRSCS